MRRLSEEQSVVCEVHETAETQERLWKSSKSSRRGGAEGMVPMRSFASGRRETLLNNGILA